MALEESDDPFPAASAMWSAWWNERPLDALSLKVFCGRGVPLSQLDFQFFVGFREIGAIIGDEMRRSRSPRGETRNGVH